MEIKTRDFGVIEVNSEDIIRFAEPIFGFEDYRDFVILFDDEIGDEIAWLQSCEDENICFVIASAAGLPISYSPAIAASTLAAVGGDYELWLIMNVCEDMAKSTVNLKSPIVYCPQTSVAAQTISDDKLPIKYALFEGKELC